MMYGRAKALGRRPMNAEGRRVLEKELEGILKITNPPVPAILDPNSPTAMSAPEVESEELGRLRKRRDEIQQMLDEDSSEEDMRARVL
jgi:hypothetical protein